jgi:hypothetical protein
MAIFSNFKNENFHFKFQKWFFKKKTFQNFLMAWMKYFNFFSFLSSGMADPFQIISNFKNENFLKNHFPVFFLNFKNKNFHFEKISFWSFSWWHKRFFFSTRGYQIYLKFTKVTFLPLKK